MNLKLLSTRLGKEAVSEYQAPSLHHATQQKQQQKQQQQQQQQQQQHRKQTKRKRSHDSQQ